jgi:hypothetical protein
MQYMSRCSMVVVEWRMACSEPANSGPLDKGYQMPAPEHYAAHRLSCNEHARLEERTGTVSVGSRVIGGRNYQGNLTS